MRQFTRSFVLPKFIAVSFIGLFAVGACGDDGGSGPSTNGDDFGDDDFEDDDFEDGGLDPATEACITYTAAYCNRYVECDSEMDRATCYFIAQDLMPSDDGCDGATSVRNANDLDACVSQLEDFACGAMLDGELPSPCAGIIVF